MVTSGDIEVDADPIGRRLAAFGEHLSSHSLPPDTFALISLCNTTGLIWSFSTHDAFDVVLNPVAPVLKNRCAGEVIIDEGLLRR